MGISENSYILIKKYGLVKIGTFKCGDIVELWDGFKWISGEIVTYRCDYQYKIWLKYGLSLECDSPDILKHDNNSKLLKYQMPSKPLIFDDNVSSHIGDKDPYTAGVFFTRFGKNIIDLNIVEPVCTIPNHKQIILKHIKYNKLNGRVAFLPYNIYKKNDIPYTESIEYRLGWITGVFDSIGTLSKNKGCISIHCILEKYNDAFSIFKILVSLGISSIISKFSHIKNTRTLNNHIICSHKWRVCIDSNNVSKLFELGITPNRLDFSTYVNPNRRSDHYNTVISCLKLDSCEQRFYTIKGVDFFMANMIIVKS